MLSARANWAYHRLTSYEGVLIRRDSKYSVQTNTCKFRKAVNLAYGQEGFKLEINIPPQHILAKS